VWMKFLLPLFAALPLLVAGAEPRLLILGDSITFDGRWPTWVESALREVPEFERAEILNLGLASETVSGLSEAGHAGGAFPRPCLHERLGRVLAGWRPTQVIVCYGMNDGIYLPPDPVRLQSFRDGMIRLKAEVEAGGARLLVLTPPLHRADEASGGGYDAVLDQFADWLVARQAEGWEVVDIRPALRESVARAKSRQPAFVYAADGVHPGEAGHRFIARAVCAGLWRLWKLPGEPQLAEGGSFALLKERQDLLKLAWLAETRHLRPGVPAGLAVAVAEARAACLLADQRALASARAGVWQGHQRIDFRYEGREGLLVRPKSEAPGRPWIWRTEFFGHEPQADLALLEKGFHVAYIAMPDLYGAPSAMEVMDGFHRHLTEFHRLSARTVLEGFSRGGLYAFNWAARRPGSVAALYVDAPVCDFKSWPGGRGRGPGSPGDWRKLMEAYGFRTEAEALAWEGNPVDRLEPLARAGIPILAVIGEADEVVPVDENLGRVEARYRELDGRIEVIRKPGGRHHPHSLRDPGPIVDFVVRAVALP
jgi:pimeloyl-ACP methyl ester carboxylesterase/lysophospholipase L1-like esterase